jgi:hypothetical protein
VSRIRVGPASEPTKERRKRARVRAPFADNEPERFLPQKAAAGAERAGGEVRLLFYTEGDNI